MISFQQTILFLAGVVILALAVNKFPSIWPLILPWLKPPYLHIVINAIIVAIVAASRFRRIQSAPPVRPQQRLVSARTPPPAYYEPYSSSPEVGSEAAAFEGGDRVVEVKPVMVNGWKVDADADEFVDEDEGENALADRNLTFDTPLPERSPPEFLLEYFRPANSTENFPAGETERWPETPERSWKKKAERNSAAAHDEVLNDGSPWPTPDLFRLKTRKSKSFRERPIHNDSPPSHGDSGFRIKASPPSRSKLSRRAAAMDISMDRSLTFNSLSSERFSPESRVDYLPPTNPIHNIRRRDRERPPVAAEEEEYETLESAWKKITEGASRAAADNLQKSNILKEGAVHDDPPPSRGSSGFCREASPSRDELNRRVDAFINKVYDDIRSERQKSLDQYIQLNSAA